MSSAGTMPWGDSRPGEARPPRRLVLLSESAGLAAVLTRLLDRRDQLTRSGWSREVAEEGGFRNADLVVLDLPRAGRAAAFQQLRRHYRGPVVVLVEHGDRGRGLPADAARTLLARPFSTAELKAALGLPELRAGGVRGTPGGSPGRTGRRPGVTRPTVPTAVPAANAPPPTPKVAPPGAADAPATLAGKAPTLVAPPAGTGGVVSMFPSAGDDRDRVGKRVGAMVDGKAAARQAPPRPGAQPGAVPPEPPRHNPLGSLFAGLVHGWRARRTVRIAGFASLAAVAFVVAFALAAQGRCGPGCDALTGIISPATTLPAADSPAAPTTSARTPAPSTTSPPGSGFQGVPGAVLGSTTSTTRRATTTTRRPSATTRPSPPTTAPPTTAPPTTAPPTTAPPTTAPPTTAGP
jgi:hypothetical protein